MTNNINSLKPRNGYLLVKMIRPEDALIVVDTPGKSGDVNVLIVAVAPDCPTEPRSNAPAYRVGDSVITQPSNFSPINQDFAFLHHSAVQAIERE